MAKKISELNSNTSPNLNSVIPIEYGNANYKVSINNLFQNLKVGENVANDGQDQIQIGGTNTFETAQQGQLSVVSNSAAAMNIESKSTSSVAVLLLKGPQCRIQFQDDHQDSGFFGVGFGKIWNVGVNDNTYSWGVLESTDINTRGSTLLSLKSEGHTDGADGNGGAYGGGDYPVVGRARLQGSLSFENIDTSDTIASVVNNEDDNALYTDMGNNLIFRAKNSGSYTRMRLNNEGSAGTVGDGAGGGAALQISQKVDGFNIPAEIVRYMGSTYGTRTDYPSTNVNEHQANLQIQAPVGRLSLSYMATVEDPNLFKSFPGSFGMQVTGGSSTGNIVGVYFYGEGLDRTTDGNYNKRSMVPQGDSMDLGNSDSQWRDIFTQNAVTVTSDKSLKQDIAELDESEKKVAIKLKNLVKKYRFKSAVKDKKEDARIHIGWIAQEVEEAFSSEGLDASRYGLFCRDTHYKVFVNGKDTGTTQRVNNVVLDEFISETIKEDDEVTYESFDFYSLRYQELHSFIISAL